MKMKFLHTTLSFIFMCLFVCCSNNNSDDSILLRISNTSSFDYKDVIINTTTGNVSFEDIESGDKTAYQSFETAYRYAYVQLEIDGSMYIIQPIDYVGETPLANGKYTYEINANESDEQYGKLSITLKEDD